MTGRHPVAVRGEDMVDGGELQQMAQLVELNRQKLERLGEQIQRLNAAVDEHREVLVGLKALSEKGGSKTMVPLGAGIQLVVDRPEDGGVVMDIGSGIQAERPITEAITMLEKRVTDIEQLVDTLQTEFDETEGQVSELAQTFNQGVAQLQEVAKQDESDEEAEDKSSPPKKKRRRSIGGELTLDD
jgi:prefoldin alpha subunit